jgi:hypothetical protein
VRSPLASIVVHAPRALSEAKIGTFFPSFSAYAANYPVPTRRPAGPLPQ